MPPSLEILEQRLIERGDISSNEIQMRIKKAKNELEFASKFDNIIINSELKESKEIAFSIIKKFIENE
jgi:guanylate kinase